MVEKTSELNSEKKITVILYWAEWCHFCTEFKPIWEELKEEISKNKDLENLVQFEDYEETKNEKLMKERNINGFPTIHINNEPYKGQRTLLNLVKAIEEIASSVQKGGDLNQDNYFYKYLKYKIKYYNLKNSF